MVGSIIGAAASLAGSIFGGYQASKAMKKSRRLLEAQLRDNQNWYDRRMSQDYTQTASSQAAMKRAMEYAEQLNRKADGQAAVNGTTTDGAHTHEHRRLGQCRQRSHRAAILGEQGRADTKTSKPV